MSAAVTGLPLRRPDHDRAKPLRLTPHHGRPRCLLEAALQHVWHHKLLWWIAAMATLGVTLQFGIGPAIHDLFYG